MSSNETPRIHPWEKHGLGKAPFMWLGVTEERGPKRYPQKDGTVIEIGAPGQPMGCCSYCGQGIAVCHRIRSADRKEFIVGSDCVEKVEHKGSPLFTAVERAARDIRNAQARARSAKKAKAANERIKELMAMPALRTLLASRPSAYAWKREQGETELDDVEWLAKRSGTAGTLRLIKRLEKELGQ